MNRARMNYWVDVGIGIGGLLSAVSGLVLLLPGDPTSGVLGVSYQLWNSLHTWSSLAAIVGVGAHMALHWNWMVAMTKQMFLPAGQQQVRGAAYAEATDNGLSRRAFLVVGGAAVFLTGAVAAGFRAISANNAEETADVSLSNSSLAATGQGSGVACPRGLINDPYPGRCHFYVDSDGDGICDYSVPGSASNLTTGDFGGGFRGGSHRRPGFGQP